MSVYGKNICASEAHIISRKTPALLVHMKILQVKRPQIAEHRTIEDL
jgi:hypothetical protein